MKSFSLVACNGRAGRSHRFRTLNSPLINALPPRSRRREEAEFPGYLNALSASSRRWLLFQRAVNAAFAILAALTSVAGSVALLEAASIPAPQIRSIASEGDALVVRVQVPPGARRVVIENCEDLARKEWKPLAWEWLNGRAAEIRFRLSLQAGLGLLRARADDPGLLPLPPSFYEGQTVFAPEWVQESLPWVVHPILNPPLTILPGDVQVTSLLQPQTFNAAANDNTEPARPVVESDIWRIDGRTVYYFNSSQGLQVIDLTDLDAPILRGALKIAGAGEELYLLPHATASDDRALALLTYDSCSSTGATVVTVVRVRNGLPRPGPRVVLPGRPRESRLVGNILYVVTDNWSAFPYLANVAGAPSDYWRRETTVTPVNLGRPETPVVGRSITVPGSVDAIYATDSRLFVAVTGTEGSWSSSPAAPLWLAPDGHAIEIFDISDSSGTVREVGHVLTAGLVSDKFKMHESGDVLSAVSFDAVGLGRTILETWSLSARGWPRVLGRLEIVSGERLHATRFDGARLYAVTFRQIDPLWIIDLSDPANPAIAGELQVPGWSTYLHPLGDRLLAMGFESWRPAVSLFDVARSNAPRLLSKVTLVDGSSEANATEKAFKVLFEEGLVLIPISGVRGTNPVQGVQLVDFDRTGLTLRGRIDHRMNALRATAVDHRLVSISPSELLTVDANDRDHPVVRGRLSLDYTVDRVWVIGPHLLQLTRANASGPGQSELRVTTQVAPRSALTRTPIDGMPLLGESLRQGRLYLMQGIGPTTTYPTGGTAITTSARLSLTVIDTTHLPELPVLAQTIVEPTNYRGGPLAALWPNDRTLVWASSRSPWFGWLVPYAFGAPALSTSPAGVNLVAAGLGQASAFVSFFPWFDSAEQRFFAFDVGSSEPRFASEVTLPPTNGVSYGLKLASGDKVFLSRNRRWPAPTSPANPDTNAASIRLCPWPCPVQYLQQHEVVVLDYRHPSRPVIRSPVALPGPLWATARDGALLFATGRHASDTNDATQYLHALAYDGFVASIVDSLSLSNATSSAPLVTDTGSILLGAGGSMGPPRLERWELEQDTRFHRRAAVKLSQSATQLDRFNDLLLVTNPAGLELRDATDAVKFRLLHREALDCTWWLNTPGADGSKAAGLWLPQGTQGLQHIPAGQASRLDHAALRRGAHR